MHTRNIVIAVASSLALACGEDRAEERGNGEPREEEAAPERPLREVVANVFEPLPERVEVNQAKMVLGRALYHDPALSGDGSVSCASCHMLSYGGAEPRPSSTGIRGQVGPINSPTVFNAQFNFRQFWDGRAADLREQAAGPIMNPIEMGGGDWPSVLARLSAKPEYVEQFRQLYGEEGISQDNVIDAIVEYERYLVTPSPFDAWLRGEDDALTGDQQRGLRLFVQTGCTTCHRGRNLGGESYQRMGLVNNYFERRGGRVTEADLGRFNVTHDEEDRHKFKVPTLRNVAVTSPYFHDGSERELAGAVRTMAHVQLGRELEDGDVMAIVAFLGSLTGTLPEDAHLPAPARDTEDVVEAHPGAPVGVQEDDRDRPAP